jgi:hypothetical protein
MIINIEDALRSSTPPESYGKRIQENQQQHNQIENWNSRDRLKWIKGDGSGAISNETTKRGVSLNEPWHEKLGTQRTIPNAIECGLMPRLKPTDGVREDSITKTNRHINQKKIKRFRSAVSNHYSHNADLPFRT